MDKKLLTTQETAEFLGISDARVRRMILDNKLTAKKFGRVNMIKKSDAEKVRVYGKAGRPKKSDAVKPVSVKSEKQIYTREEQAILDTMALDLTAK